MGWQVDRDIDDAKHNDFTLVALAMGIARFISGMT